jgi:anthranilate phosphoribosyltransferase
MLGVSEERFAAPVAEALRRLGSRRAMVVHSVDPAERAGYDELTTLGPATLLHVEASGVRAERLDPASLGLATPSAAEMRAGDIAHAARMFRGVIDGDPGPALDTTLLSAAAALVVADAAGSIASGLALARDAVESGRARRVLETLARVSHAG